MRNDECVIWQYRNGKPVRSFTPSGDKQKPWSMNVNGKSYLRTSGWVLSKILPTLVEGDPNTTVVFPFSDQVAENPPALPKGRR